MEFTATAMAISKKLKLLFTSGSLIAAALASPVGLLQKVVNNDDDDIDDTPLPLVIWHGTFDMILSQCHCLHN